MLIENRKYIFQIVSALDGTRAEPFILTPNELQELLVKEYDSEKSSKFYVLVLADVTQNIKPQDFVSRFPLYTLESWSNLSFKSADELEHNHG